MRSLKERENALNMYFKDRKSYGEIAKKLGIPRDTVKSWCQRYRKKLGLPKRDNNNLLKEGVCKEAIHSRAPKADFTEDRIARLEMEVELLRNFLILTERG